MKEFWKWMIKNKNVKYGDEKYGYELTEKGITINILKNKYKKIELDERMIIGYMIEYLSASKIDWELSIPFYDDKFDVNKLYFWLKNQINLIEEKNK